VTTPNVKFCAQCRERLPASAFRPSAKEVGPLLWCRACSIRRTREWRAAHREELNARRRVPPVLHTCLECGEQFLGSAKRLLCGKRSCKDARFRRLHPEAFREARRRHDERLRARRNGEPK
jgi:hypothetical protein